jgi:hypothetical protein
MECGLTYEIESVEPWPADRASGVFWNNLEQIELADHIGFDSAWCVET